MRPASLAKSAMRLRLDFLFAVGPFRSLFRHRDTSAIEVAEVSAR